MNTYLVIAAAVVSLIMAFGLYRKNASIQVEDARMREIAGYIQEGAMAYLKRQYIIMLAFSVLMFVLLLVVLDGPTAICFLVGALFSVLAGFSGMISATRANVRTAQKATEGMSAALNVAFSGGAILGLCVVGLGALGVAILAGVGAGLYESVPAACRAMIKRNPAQDPIEENVPKYAAVYALYKKLYQANKELFKDLAAL